MKYSITYLNMGIRTSITSIDFICVSDCSCLNFEGLNIDMFIPNHDYVESIFKLAILTLWGIVDLIFSILGVPVCLRLTKIWVASCKSCKSHGSMDRQCCRYIFKTSWTIRASRKTCYEISLRVIVQIILIPTPESLHLARGILKMSQRRLGIFCAR